MATLIIESKRNVVPNWRDYSTTAMLGELYGNNAILQNKQLFPINDYIIAWKSNPLIPFAGDLISAAIMSNQQLNPFVQEAARFVIERAEDVSDSLYRTALTIVGKANSFSSERKKSLLERLDDIINKDNVNKQRIGFLRKLIHRYPYNPIWYNELALTYSKLGLVDKAVDCMKIAIHLAPNSRYISRSAARLFLHMGDPDKAHYVLINNPSISRDPWIVAAEIGVNSLRGRSSRFTKSGISMINSGDYSPFSLTELSSAIGTMEFNHSKKKCKAFIDKALICPNDNSLSQAEWLLSLDKSMAFSFSDYSSVKNKFEADSRRAFMDNDYSQALIASVDWIEEMPFAKTPIDFAANMAFTFTKNYEEAILILKIGLISNPKELSFLNNLAYSYALNGNVSEAENILYSPILNSLPIDSDIYICVMATKGLCSFRKGNISEGRMYYQNALSLAKIQSKINLCNKALLNYIREELLATKHCDDKLKNTIDILHTGNERETIVMRQDIRDLISRYR